MIDCMKWLTGRALISRLAGKWQHAPSIVLCYHDLRHKKGFSSWLRCTEENFNKQLDVLSSIGDFLAPDDFFNGDNVRNSRIRFLLTFDDGYVNNLRIGLPLLGKYKVPCVFFISTKQLTEGGLFWHDRVIGPIQSQRMETLDLRKDGLNFYNFSKNDSNERWSQIQKLLEDLKAIGNDENPIVSCIIDRLEEMSVDAWHEAKNECRPINTFELAKMAKNPWCHFGAHGHEHEILTRLERPQIAYNISHSKKILEDITGKKINFFSYPNGNFNRIVKEELSHAGYCNAFTTKKGVMKANSPRFEIPRLLVGGYDKVSDVITNINVVLLYNAIIRG